MNRQYLWTLALAALVVSGALLPVSIASGSGEGEEPAGRTLFVDTHKCNMCHAVPAAEIEAKTKSEKMLGAQLGGKVEVDFEKLAAYLRKAGDLEGKTHKKEFKGTDEELQTILDWLGSLEAQE